MQPISNQYSCHLSFDSQSQSTISGDSIAEIIVGRDDGNVEIYSICDGQPTLLHTSNVAESITSIGAGNNNATRVTIAVTMVTMVILVM